MLQSKQRGLVAMKHELQPLSSARMGGRPQGGVQQQRSTRERLRDSFDCMLDKCIDFVGSAMYWVGPFFVATGLLIICFTAYVGFGILLPAKCKAWSVLWVRAGGLYRWQAGNARLCYENGTRGREEGVCGPDQHVTLRATAIGFRVATVAHRPHHNHPISVFSERTSPDTAVQLWCAPNHQRSLQLRGEQCCVADACVGLRCCIGGVGVVAATSAPRSCLLPAPTPMRLCVCSLSLSVPSVCVLARVRVHVRACVRVCRDVEMCVGGVRAVFVAPSKVTPGPPTSRYLCCARAGVCLHRPGDSHVARVRTGVA